MKQLMQSDLSLKKTMNNDPGVLGNWVVNRSSRRVGHQQYTRNKSNDITGMLLVCACQSAAALLRTPHCCCSYATSSATQRDSRGRLCWSAQTRSTFDVLCLLELLLVYAI